MLTKFDILSVLTYIYIQDTKCVLYINELYIKNITFFNTYVNIEFTCLWR